MLVEYALYRGPFKQCLHQATGSRETGYLHRLILLPNCLHHEQHVTKAVFLPQKKGRQKKLEELGVEAENAELMRIPHETKELSNDEALKVLRIIDEFEEDEDVQNVWHNLELTDSLVEAMG